MDLPCSVKNIGQEIYMNLKVIVMKDKFQLTPMGVLAIPYAQPPINMSEFFWRTVKKNSKP